MPPPTHTLPLAQTNNGPAQCPPTSYYYLAVYPALLIVTKENVKFDLYVDEERKSICDAQKFSYCIVTTEQNPKQEI